MPELAINGGRPVREKPFPAHNFIGKEEKARVQSVLDTGVLSKYLGAWHPDFYGGSQVREFEDAWCEAFDAGHAVSVNSATSGLVAAVGAVGVGPGDEVIVTPYTMSATATAVIAYHAVPVFVDIQDDIYCLDPAKIEVAITSRTKAIIVVHLFGHPADMDPIMEIARRHGLKVVEDCAQAPGARYKGRQVGTLGDLGVFSLNFHKHLHTGEGGVVTTNDDELAERTQLIRNHGENIVGPKGVEAIENTFGFNFRLTEIPAAIGIEQLRKLPGLLEWRLRNAAYLANGLARFPGIRPPVVYDGCTHAYYVQAFQFDSDVVGVARDGFIDAVAAELPSSPERPTIPLISSGYARPLYMAPMYQRKIAIGGSGCPFECPHYQGRVDYREGICPVTERLYASDLFINEFIRPPAVESDLDDVIRAFEKVYEHLDELPGAGSR